MHLELKKALTETVLFSQFMPIMPPQQEVTAAVGRDRKSTSTWQSPLSHSILHTHLGHLEAFFLGSLSSCPFYKRKTEAQRGYKTCTRLHSWEHRAEIPSRQPDPRAHIPGYSASLREQNQV